MAFSAFFQRFYPCLLSVRSLTGSKGAWQGAGGARGAVGVAVAMQLALGSTRFCCSTDFLAVKTGRVP